MKGVVSRIPCARVLNGFSLEPRVVLTQKPVGATRQEKLSMLVKAVWHYDVPLPRSRKLQTDRLKDTHTHGIQL